MKNKLLVMAMAAAIVAISGCAKSQPDTSRTAMQKRYNSQAECQKDFPKDGDCTRVTGNTAGAGGHGGGFFMSPYFYPWGAVMHSNGSVDYNNRVPSSGYAAAPAHVQKSLSSSNRVSFSRAPSYSSGSVRGGFGSSARGGFSSGG